MLRTSTIRRFSFINSRAHEGRDTPPGNGRRTATQFQLTRPRGARPTAPAPEAPEAKFQLTRPRGARLQSLRFPGSQQCLNSRAREGRDLILAAGMGLPAEFQLTRPRGARRGEHVAACYALRVSTHAPARGATGTKLRELDAVAVSTHAPARGATVPCIT